MRGEAPAHVVLEAEACMAFLDERPLFPGHCLLVPRAHFETLADLPPALLAPLFGHARLLARAVERGLGAEGSFVALNNRVSQSVAHLHVHVVPRRRGDGLRGAGKACAFCAVVRGETPAHLVLEDETCTLGGVRS